MKDYIFKIDDTFTKILRRENKDFSNWECVVSVRPQSFSDGFNRVRFLEKTLELCKKYMMD